MDCPCGATPLSALQCQDEPFPENDVPTCGRRCGKKLPCSTQGEQHICRSQCHNGLCPPCTKSRIVQCYECKDKLRLDCQEIDLTNQYVCSKCFRPCKKIMNCGRHQCGKHNCEEQETPHLCNKKCMKRLPCGNHDCEQPCHSGDCTQTSIKKLSCDCGEEVRVQCGVKTPKCKKPCARVHACAHKVTHTCHNKETCPPCYAQVQRTCVGGHNTSTVDCYEDKITCNVMCGKPLPCGHKCQEKCHDGICKKECKQPCLIKCKNGSHKCGATCHYPHKCPQTSCKETVTLKCKCSNKEQKALCFLVQGHGKPLECGTGCTARVKRRRDPGVDFEDWVIAQLESFTEKAQKGLIPPEYKFEPTTSFNRRIIHDQATAHGCTSESFGVEPNRYTVVSITSSECLDEEFYEDYDCYDPDLAEENVVHPLLERELDLVQAMCGLNALETRIYGGIDEMDIFINIDLNSFLDEHMASAWGVNESQPLIILLHIMSISKYLEGLEPKVSVFQVKDDVAPTASAYAASTKRCKIGISSQLEKILQAFVSKQWRKIGLSTVERAMSGETPSSKTPGTHHPVDPREDAKLAKLVEIGFGAEEAREAIHQCCGDVEGACETPSSKTPGTLQPVDPREDAKLAKLVEIGFGAEEAREALHQCLGDVEAACELLVTTPSGAFSSGGGSGFLSSLVSFLPGYTRQDSMGAQFEVTEHHDPEEDKRTPSLEKGFLVQVVRYALNRLKSLDEFCVICDEKHVLDSGLIKPCVCTRELCVFAFQTLGVMADAAEAIATDRDDEVQK